MMVGFGQVICLPVGPRCDVCLLGQRRICPSRVSNVKAEGRKEVIYTFTSEDCDGESVAMVEVKYEDDLVPMKEEENVKAELIEEAAMEEEGVLDVLDRVDGVMDTGAGKGAKEEL
jgi:endonuclease-3